MKYMRVFAIAAVAVAILVAFGVGRSHSRRMQLTTYFSDGHRLRAGAPVRLAGVEIGFVKTVRVRPELKDHPVEVVMTIDTPYDLKIPRDAIVSLETAGVLGETFANIDLRNTAAPPVWNHGVLKSRPSEPPEALLEQLAERLGPKCAGDETGSKPLASPKKP